MTDDFDMKEALSEMSSSLFGSTNSDENSDESVGEKETQDEVKDEPQGGAQDAKQEGLDGKDDAAKAKREAPKSWKKEMHEAWGKLDPSVQDYVDLREKQMIDGLDKDRGDANLGRTMRDIMTPYRAMIQAQGIDEPRAVQVLLNAHYKLSNGDAQARSDYFRVLAKQYGIDVSSLGGSNESKADPAFTSLKNELDGIKQTLSRNQAASFEEARKKVGMDVDKFASDPKHSYFDEVSDDIATMIRAGYDLETAYEKAVWANPVTRQKEVLRLQQENEKASNEKRKQEVEAAKKAASTNIRGRDSSRTPTGPKGSIDDTLRETLDAIYARA